MIENLKRTIAATRFRNVLCASLLVAATIAALGAVGFSPTAAEGTSESASRDNNGWRVDVSSRFDVTSSLTPSCPRCFLPMVLSENFDGVIPPALPADWLATNALGPPPLWVTSNSGVPNPPADTPPNAAFIDDPAVVSDKRLDSLQFSFFERRVFNLQLTFRHNFNLEASDVDLNLGFDGGVLELSTDGGNTFQDILAAGGSFVMGGYNRTISTDRGSPIAGRQAWSGNSGGFITTVVHIPAIQQPGRLRWRMASDNSGAGEGWRVDTITISWCEEGPQCGPRPRPTPAPRPSP